MSRCSSVMIVMMSVLMMVSTRVALAQDAPLKPPTTKEPPSGPKFLVIGLALLLTGLVIFVATLKSRRGHQD